MERDGEGFSYPSVDGTECRHCGLCERACPALHRGGERTPLAVHAAKALDEGLRLASSSGGVFSLLAQAVLERGGVVIGAACDNHDGHVFHVAIDKVADIARLRGAKYVQSDMDGMYRRAREALSSGEKDVLFSGTPCQIAAFRQYLSLFPRVDAGRLLLVDVVCHAVPSPLAWRKYMEQRSRSACKGKGAGRREATSISFRSKNAGWKKYAVSLDFADGPAYRSYHRNDFFMRAFLNELCNRPSCHDCRFRHGRSGSDLTLGDYWNADSRFPDMDDDKGVSLVLVNTARGERAFKTVENALETRRSDFAHAVEGNPPLVRSIPPHPRRAEFFRSLQRCRDFDELVSSMFRPPFMRRLRSFAGKALGKLVGWK
jgi:coenzyme F420-reducing hydrogenase beta subunit